ncbi:MAG TPA: crotonase/enoyl-CoA hydratase family protein [Deltaproteobacteria bacterium]|nr:crotonase/enoyl-CoA hydratase family protein [Deltaproteobacteria bacterium]
MGVVTRENRDGIEILRIDHGKPNSISKAVSDELIRGLDEAEKSADAVVILGKPGIFSGGFDLPTMGKGVEAAREMLRAGAILLMSIYNHPKPVVIGCTGHAIAMGTFILLAGDERIGAEGAFKIGANESAIGMTLPTFAMELARARISKRHFDRMIVHSTIYDPAGAVDAGILDRVVAGDRVEAECLEAARRLAALKQPAFRNNKRLAHEETVHRILSTLDENLDSLMPK